MKFCSLSSGSSGNCYYISNESATILIDAGIGIRAIKRKLKELGITLQDIYGIFVTHDHYDHIASIGTLGGVYNIPIHSTQKILDAINNNHKITEKLYQCRRPFDVGQVVEVGDFKITSFEVEHDSTQCVGYYIEDSTSNLFLATDLGKMNPTAEAFMKRADNVIIEANYDEEMLLEGKYPLFLKKRILSNAGHLANHITARCLCDAYQEHWKRIFFCHLSKENNCPEVVLKTMDKALREKVGEYQAQLCALPRLESTEIFEL